LNVDNIPHSDSLLNLCNDIPDLKVKVIVPQGIYPNGQMGSSEELPLWPIAGPVAGPVAAFLTILLQQLGHFMVWCETCGLWCIES
jgi:hypothetical protein